MVLTVASQLNLPPRGYTLALSGGVLLHQINYLEQLLGALSAKAETGELQPGRWIKVEEPVSGAVA